MDYDCRAIRAPGAGGRAARPRLRRCLLRPGRVEAGGDTKAASTTSRPASALICRASSRRPAASDEMAQLRRQYLTRQLAAWPRASACSRASGCRSTRSHRRSTTPTAPTAESHFEEVLDALENASRAPGPLVERTRHSGARSSFPKEARPASSRPRSRPAANGRSKHLALPPDESFTVEYVTDKSWSGYNWYQGNFRSLIQVNTDLPIYIDRAVDLACHEGYPGHHVYNALLEKHLVRDRGWIEFTVYPLFSPQSLIAEGTANYGIAVAFPGDERIEYEQKVLFPAAGLDPARARGVLRGAGAGREARLCRQRGGAPLHQQGDRRRAGGGVARAVRADADARAPSSACDSSTSTAATSSTTTSGKTWSRSYIEAQSGRGCRSNDGRSSARCSRRRGCRPGFASH